MIVAVTVVVAPTPVPFIAVVAPAPVAGAFQIATRIARLFAMAPEAVDGTIKPPLGMVDTITAIFPTLGLRWRTAHH